MLLLTKDVDHLQNSCFPPLNIRTIFDRFRFISHCWWHHEKRFKGNGVGVHLEADVSSKIILMFDTNLPAPSLTRLIHGTILCNG
jgi:hypothetical protein